jgi:hypothetical protein
MSTEQTRISKVPPDRRCTAREADLLPLNSSTK